MIARSGEPRPGAPLPSGKPDRTWTVGDLIVWTEQHFRKLGLVSPRLDAELLLARVMGLDRIELYTGWGQVVEAPERSAFRELVLRRSRREPVAYILGAREFYSLSLEVSPAVLIPRPETEVLVERAIEDLRARCGERPVSVLDLGTGSGNIATAIAVNLPLARVTAVDRSAEALKIARRNAARHGVEDRVTFLEGDLFEPLEAPGHSGSRHDAIVSNPPYVSSREYPDLMRDVREYEPPSALLDGKGGSGLGFYREIVASAPRFVAPGGLLAVEVGEAQARVVERLVGESGWHAPHAVADYAGIARVVLAHWPEVE